ncbi:Cyanide hydratase, partial [Tolypocladium capitatum]
MAGRVAHERTATAYIRRRRRRHLNQSLTTASTWTLYTHVCNPHHDARHHSQVRDHLRPPDWFDPETSVRKTVALILETDEKGCKLIAFPEGSPSTQRLNGSPDFNLPKRLPPEQSPTRLGRDAPDTRRRERRPNRSPSATRSLTATACTLHRSPSTPSEESSTTAARSSPPTSSASSTAMAPATRSTASSSSTSTWTRSCSPSGSPTLYVPNRPP